MRIEYALNPNCSEAVFRFYTLEPEQMRDILQALADEVNANTDFQPHKGQRIPLLEKPEDYATEEVSMLKLTPQGMVHYRNGAAVRFDREETTRVWGFHGFPEDIPSPEVVHLEVTADCNLNCPYCYVEKHKDGLPTDSWLNIIGELADLGTIIRRLALV